MACDICKKQFIDKESIAKVVTYLRYYNIEQNQMSLSYWMCKECYQYIIVDSIADALKIFKEST